MKTGLSRLCVHDLVGMRSGVAELGVGVEATVPPKTSW